VSGLEQRVYQHAPAWLQTVLLNAQAARLHRERYGPTFEALEAAWDRSQWWEPARLRDWQAERLREIARVAYERVPFYRRRFDACGVRPEEITGPEDLRRLPVLTKADVREAGPGLLTRPASALVHGHTSGTTGSPLSLWYDRAMCIANNVADWRQKGWAGMRRDAWCGVFLGRVVVPITVRRPPFWRRNYLHRQVWFSSFHLSEANLAIYVQEIRRRRLRFLEGYPSTLYILASYLRRRGERLPMQAVFSSSETLHAVQRETLAAAFECPVFDFYGLAERMAFAGECETHDGKHLFDEYGVTEIVDDAGEPVAPGQRGWLVGTTLWNQGMPLIRYRTSDLTARLLEPCACGRGLGRIAAVTTKAEDIVVTPDGRYVSPSVLTHPFKPFHQLLKSQVIQDSVDRLHLKLVASDAFTPAHCAALVAGLRERLGEGMEVSVEMVDDIPPEPSGKFRWVISRVAHGCAVPWDG
jgi:phenylacetate-CoA ligase